VGKVRKKKLRPLGNVLLDIEPLYLEIVSHNLQRSDIIGLMLQYDETHGLDSELLEHYTDGTTAVTYHGHIDGLIEMAKRLEKERRSK
jgi:hypothetical protein